MMLLPCSPLIFLAFTSGNARPTSFASAEQAVRHVLAETTWKSVALSGPGPDQRMVRSETWQLAEGQPNPNQVAALVRHLGEAPARCLTLIPKHRGATVALFAWELTDAPEIPIPDGCPLPPSWPPPPTFWKRVFVACSNGLDSLVMLHRAIAQYGPERIVVLYNVLGNEHPGSPQQAGDRCREWGVPLVYTWKDEGNRSCWGWEIPTHYLEQEATMPDEHDLVVRLAEGRGMWPGGGNALCTSSGKRDTGDVAMRALAAPEALMPAEHDLVVRLAEKRGQWPSHNTPLCTSRGKEQTSDVVVRSEDVLGTLNEEPGAFLILTGEMGVESERRKRKPDWQLRSGATSPQKGRLVVWHRLMLHWTKEEAFAYAIQHSIPLPTSYQNFFRHSCAHCIYKSWEELVLAFILYPVGAARRVAAEKRMGHVVRLNLEFEGELGYGAVGRFVYGPFDGSYCDKKPLPRALEAIVRWKADGKLFQPPSGVTWAS